MRQRSKTEERNAGRKTGFIGSAVLAAGLALGGCDTINNYYFGPDGGPKPDAMLKADSGMKPDAVAADSSLACNPSAKTLPECSDSVLVAGVLNQGEALVVPTTNPAGVYRLVLDDGQILNGKNYAAVSLTDECGAVLMKSKIEEGATKTFMLGGRALDVTVTEALFGYTFGAKWANLTVKAPCQDQYWCPAVSGILNQGESLLVDNMKFQLDDLEAHNSVTAAILSVLDANGNILLKDKIDEGSSKEISISGKQYRVTVKKAAAGITFGAKWAEIEISTAFDNPCGSP